MRTVGVLLVVVGVAGLAWLTARAAAGVVSNYSGGGSFSDGSGADFGVVGD